MSQELAAGRSKEFVIHQGVVSGLTRRVAEKAYRIMSTWGA